MAVPPTRARPAASQHTPFALPVTGAACGGGGGGSSGGAGAASSPPEWALVELQGELEPPAGTGPGADYEAGTLALSKTVRGDGVAWKECDRGWKTSNLRAAASCELFFFFNPRARPI
jgi:hypothetical protein